MMEFKLGLNLFTHHLS